MAHKPHAVCIPYPAQGHINPMLKLAKLLHHKGFYITFIHTEHNYRRLLRSRGPDALNGFPDFQFDSIPDGLPPSEDVYSSQEIAALCPSVSKNCLVPFRNLVNKLNSSRDVPNVTCIVGDGIMTFTLEVAREIGVPSALFWTTSACGFLGYTYIKHLLERGIIPLKDESYLTNGYMDTTIDWIPGMEGIRLKDIPAVAGITDPNDFFLHFTIQQVNGSSNASAIILNTYDDLECDVLEALSSMFPPIYAIGPLHMLVKNIPEIDQLSSIGSNLWIEDTECLQWLDSKEPNSVVYVNYGSMVNMTHEHLVELAWGLANSKQNFLWIVRSDIVKGESAILPADFFDETKERGLIKGWCSQEKILKHPSIGGFLSHMGWNSTIESLSNGVPMICWPFLGEQPTNCWFACEKWGIGVEIDGDVKREEVEKLVRGLMEEENGKEMRRRAMEWKRSAQEATNTIGRSSKNFDRLVSDVLLSPLRE